MKRHFDALTQNPANYVPLTPVAFLRRAAALYPKRIAVIYGETQQNWQNFATDIDRIAANLNELGLGEGDTIAILCPNIPELFALHFALPLSGTVMNTLNTRLEAETIAYILDHGDAECVIVEAEYIPLLQRAMALLDHDIRIIEIHDALAPHEHTMGGIPFSTLLRPTKNTCTPLTNEWQAISLNYTSGTSGRPKGVVYHHRGAYLMAMGTVAAWQMKPFPIYLSVVPMFHCNGWGHPWVMAILAGTMVFTRTPAPDKVFAAIARHNITHFGAAPIVLQMLTESEHAPGIAYDPPLRVMTAGAPPPPSILEKTRAMGFQVMQVYGLTETYGHVVHCLWQDGWTNLPINQIAQKQAQQGIALPMVDAVTVIDRTTGEQVPQDGQSQGEIAIRGNTMMKGYYKDGKATQSAFDEGWFWSGDAAVVHDDGYIQVNDRLKDVIISGGENVSSIEVETVLHRHPAVQTAAVVAKQDSGWGEVPCAFIETHAGKSVTAGEIIAFCRQHLAGFKTPKAVVFGNLPKTSTGKIQKFVLRQQLKSASKSADSSQESH